MSFVPGEVQRIWRNLSRMRLQLVRDRVASRHAIAQGETDAENLAKLGYERLHCPRERLIEARIVSCWPCNSSGCDCLKNS